jgi:glyoxylase-like metal-dependent hydrolase (beta-lactamase superfamily II)
LQVHPETHPSLHAASDTWRVTLLARGGATRASSVLARRGRDVAIFDTGMGHHDRSLAAALAAEGLRPDDVTLVFNTHGHVDHSHNNILFRRARIFCSARDREWTRQVHDVLERLDRPSADDIAPFYPEVLDESHNPKLIRKVLGIEKMLWDHSRWGPSSQAVWLEEAAPPPGIHVVETPGHSPHHVSFVIETAGRPVLICGDALLLRGEEDYEAPMMPPWSTPLYRESQARIHTFDGLIVPGHDEPFDNVQKTISKPPAK